MQLLDQHTQVGWQDVCLIYIADPHRRGYTFSGDEVDTSRDVASFPLARKYVDERAIVGKSINAKGSQPTRGDRIDIESTYTTYDLPAPEGPRMAIKPP